jgi:hypothetical protein
VVRAFRARRSESCESQAWFAANVEPLVTTDYCVDETLTLLVARKRSKLVLEAGRLFFDEELAQLHFVTPNQVRRAWILLQQIGKIVIQP